MKAIDLRKKTIRNFVIAIVIAILLGVGMLFNNKEKVILNEKLKNINSEVSKLDKKSQDLESKQKEITKYIHIWKNLKENKKSLIGINMDEVNSMLDSLSRKYFVVGTDIKLGLPNLIKSGIFNTKKIDVVYTKAILKFKALDDASSMRFLNDFFQNIPGYYAIHNISIERRSTLSNQDFVSISKGKFPNIINVSTEFSWYAFKSRNFSIKDDNNKKSKRLIKL